MLVAPQIGRGQDTAAGPEGAGDQDWRVELIQQVEGSRGDVAALPDDDELRRCFGGYIPATDDERTLQGGREHRGALTGGAGTQIGVDNEHDRGLGELGAMVHFCIRFFMGIAKNHALIVRLFLMNQNSKY
jgi:hypothetical protein